MGISYTFHLSSKSHAVGNIQKVAQVSRHNTRAYKSGEYDQAGIEILQGSNSVLADLEQVYAREFDDCVSHYNEGRRKDRQIHNYMEHVSESRTDIACEIIVQIGDMDFWQDKTPDERRQMTPVFREQITRLEELCPGFKVASAIVHYDESSPHMHIVGVPVVDGMRNGMERQVAKSRVFTKESLSMLQTEMRRDAELCMQAPELQNLFAGMQINDKQKGRNKDIPKHALSEYSELQVDIMQADHDLRLLEQNVASCRKECAVLSGRHADLQARILASESELEDISLAKDILNADLGELGGKKAHLESVLDSMADEEQSLQASIKQARDEYLGIEQLKQDIIDDISSGSLTVDSRFAYMDKAKSFDKLMQLAPDEMEHAIRIAGRKIEHSRNYDRDEIDRGIE